MNERVTGAITDTPVIVLNWEGWRDTFQCLRSLRDAPDVTTVWLVDNGSTVDRSDEAREIYPGLRVLRLDRNHGFAGGMNRGMRVAAEEGYAFVYLLNNDCAVVPGFLAAALASAAAPDVAIVGSRITGYGESSGLLFFDGDYHVPQTKAVDRWSGNRRVSHVNGAGMLVRLAALQQAGYFDERFFCYHEEVELCWRLTRAGWGAVVAGESLILHRRKGSDIRNNALYYSTRNRFLLLEHFKGWTRLKRRLRLLRAVAGLGWRARRLGNRDEWLAVAAAVDDGMHARFGKRELGEVPAAAASRLRMICRLWPVGRWSRTEAVESFGQKTARVEGDK